MKPQPLYEWGFSDFSVIVKKCKQKFLKNKLLWLQYTMNLKDSRTCENPGCGDVCVDLIRCGKCEKSYK